MFNGGLAGDCACTVLKENFSLSIWLVASPLIAIYGCLLFVGATNVYRFIKVKSMSKNLALIYIFSMVSCLCWILCFALVTQPNEYQYPPYATAVYAKILVGIAY